MGLAKIEDDLAIIFVRIFFFEPNTCSRRTIKLMAKYAKEDAMIDAIVVA
jgi:hypothetical protein